MGALPDMCGERWVNPLPDEASRAKWEKFQQTKYKQFVFEALKHAARNFEVKAWTINQIEHAYRTVQRKKKNNKSFEVK